MIVTAQRTKNVGRFVAIASGWDENLVMTSSDGINWVQQTIAGPESWTDICYSPYLGLFMILGADKYALSPDGVSWTVYTLPVNWIYGIGWSSDLKLFVMVSGSYDGWEYTSPDGINWTKYTNAFEVVSKRTIWNSDNSIFVSAGGTGFDTSPDGINWTHRPVTGTWNDVVWADSLSLFVSCARSSIVTSPTGALWTSRTIDVGEWEGIAWSPELEVLVVVGGTYDFNGGGSRYSTDGINWNDSGSLPGYAWKGVTWSSELSLFVAVGSVTNLDAIATSPDGINWTLRPSSPKPSFKRVAWAN